MVITRIDQELKQTRPFPTRREEASVALLRSADLLRRLASTVVERRGITLQQYNVLRILRGAGERGLPTLDIADRMIEQTPGITRLIDRLESKKLVARERREADRRQVFCKITKSGLDLVNSLDEPVRASEEEALSAMSSREIASLIDLLDRTRDGVRRAIQLHSQPTEES